MPLAELPLLALDLKIIMVADRDKQPSIINLLKEKKRLFSAELIPPRNGTETDAVLKQIERLKKVPVDFLSVTKGAGGSLRGGTLPIAQLIKERFQTCALAHFTCRDYTIEEIENNLMDHYYFGVKNILALRGDPPDGILEDFEPGPNRHRYAHQLVRQISQMNQGYYLSRKGFDKSNEVKKGLATDFCIGVAAYPEHAPFEEALDFFKLKVDSGAHFAITQMIYSAENYSKFIEGIEKRGAGIPVLPGLRVLTNANTAVRMKTKFGVDVPDSLIEKLAAAPNKEDAKKIGVDFANQLCAKFLEYGAPGIHVFVMNDEETGAQLLERLSS